MHVQSCCFACINLLLFFRSRFRRRRRPYCCDQEILLPWQREVTLLSISTTYFTANKEMSDFKHSVSKIVNPDQKISRKSQY